MKQRKPTREDLGPFLLTASGRFATVRPLAWVIAALFVLIEIAARFNDGDWARVPGDVPYIVAIWVGFVVLMRLAVNILRVRVYARGIEGRSYWGVRRRFLWDNIAGYRLDGASGLSALVLIEAETKRELYMLAEIADREEFQTAIAPYFDWRSIVDLGR